jgi:hypothetical protein
MMRTLIRPVLIAAISLTLAVCGPSASTGTPEPARQTTLVVENQSTLQVTVYVLRGAQRQRLGTAAALRTTRLTIPDNIIFGVTSLRFEVDPLGSRQTPMSEEIAVAPGEEVTIVIPSTLR